MKLNSFQIHFTITVNWKSKKEMGGEGAVKRKGKRKMADRTGCSVRKAQVTWEISPASLSLTSCLLLAAFNKVAELEDWWSPFPHISGHTLSHNTWQTCKWQKGVCWGKAVIRTLIQKTNLRIPKWGKNPICGFMNQREQPFHLRDSPPNTVQVEQSTVSIIDVSMEKQQNDTQWISRTSGMMNCFVFDPSVTRAIYR